MNWNNFIYKQYNFLTHFLTFNSIKMKHLFTILLLFGAFYAKAQTITGKVTDATTNATVVGATVKLVGTDKGTVTDAEGKFSLEGTGSIQVSFVGYKTFQIKAKNRF